MSEAFNEWMRRFTETPEQYEHQFQNVVKFLSDTNQGVTPSYGTSCEAYLTELINE